MSILTEVRQYLNRTGTAPTRLGREALNDPRAIHDFLNGREPRPAAQAKLRAYMKAHPEGHARPNRGQKQRVVQQVHIDVQDETYQDPYPEGEEPDRGPCPYCAVRGDKGCEHRPPLGKIEYKSWGQFSLDKGFLAAGRAA